jgi:hypothetical protein
MRVRIFHWLTVGSLITGVSCKGNDGGLGLSERVDVYCGDLASELDFAADKYNQFAAGLDSNQMPADQRERVGTLLSTSMPLTLEARGVKMLEVHKRFLFCIGATKIDKRREEEVESREAVLEDEVAEQDFDLPGVHRGISHVAAVKDIRELAALVREVSRLPRKD